MMPDRPSRKLATILFADIAGYTAIMQHDEPAALLQLAGFKDTLETHLTGYQGQIIQYYGDGCLILFGSSVEAVGFANSVQKDFSKNPKALVRIGIHTGDIVEKDGLVYGDAVNIASRIESIGVPGSVLLSQAVREQIKNRPEFELHPLGSFAFKNVKEPMLVFALTGAGLAIPDRSAIEGKLQQRTSGLVPFRAKYLWSFGIVAVVLLALGSWFIFTDPPTDEEEPASLEQTIALIPLRNLSGIKDQDYFADGIVESIYGKLAQVSNLRVTSMTSVLGYRDQPKKSREIAKELNVDHILEGSVLRDDNRVRIVVRLIDANQDRQLWTETYERELRDIFSIQSSIAQSVVSALQTTLSSAEQSRISNLEITDISAYDLYLSGLNDYHQYGKTLDTSLNESAFRKARQAIGLDSRFDNAYTLLADCWFARRSYGFGERVLDSAEYYADFALRLDQNNSDALCRKGRIAWENARYNESKTYAEKALSSSPNNSEALELLAIYYLYESESVERSIPLFVKAITLNPRDQNNFEGNISLYINLGNIYLRADLLVEAEALFKKALELSPGMKSLDALTLLGYLYYVKGDFDKSFVFRKQQLALTPDDFGAINEYAGVNYAAGNFDEAEKYYRKLMTKINSGFEETHRSYIFRHRLAHIYLMTNRGEEARNLFDKHLKNEMADLKTGTRHFGQEYAIAGAYAAMDDRENAYAWLEKMPFWYITYQYIRVDPLFVTIRKEDRFNQIMVPHHEKMKRLQISIKTLESDGQLQFILDRNL